MRAFAIFRLASCLVVMASPSFAQQPSPAPAPTAPTAGPDDHAPAASNARAAVQKKRAACREAGTSQGLRGPDLQDQVAVCVLEARLACLKQAIAQKVRGRQRTDFIVKCLGS